MQKNGDWVSLLVAIRLLDGMAGLVNQAISQFMEMIDGHNALVIIKCSSSTQAKAKDMLVHQHYIVVYSFFDGDLPGVFIVFIVFMLSSFLSGSTSTLPPWAWASASFSFLLTIMLKSARGIMISA
jgi:hypothetical protein